MESREWRRERERGMLHYLCRRQNEPRQPPSSFLSSSSSSSSASSSLPSLAAMHSTSNPGCNRRCSRGKSSEKTIRATVLLFLPPPFFLSLSPSPLRVCTEGGTFPTSCFQLVPRLFRPFSSLCPPPIRNTFYSCTRIRSRFSQAAARIYVYIYMYISVRRLIFFFFFILFRFFFLEWFLWYLGGLIPSGRTTFDRVTPFVAHLFHGSVCRSVHDWISRFGSKFFLSFLPFFL